MLEELVLLAGLLGVVGLLPVGVVDHLLVDLLPVGLVDLQLVPVDLLLPVLPVVGVVSLVEVVVL